MKYIKYVREHFNDPRFPVVRLSDLRTALKLKGISDSYLKRLVNHMTSSGELKRITRGVYTLHDDITVVGFAFSPFYYGLENALTIRKLWEQGTNPIVITSRTVREGARKFGSSNYVVRRIDRKLLFGYDLVKYYDSWIPVSDYEKTFLDLVYFGHNIRNDILDALKRKISKKRLKIYLKNYPPGFRSGALDILRS